MSEADIQDSCSRARPTCIELRARLCSLGQHVICTSALYQLCFDASVFMMRLVRTQTCKDSAALLRSKTPSGALSTRATNFLVSRPRELSNLQLFPAPPTAPPLGAAPETPTQVWLLRISNMDLQTMRIFATSTDQDHNHSQSSYQDPLCHP